MTDGRRLAHAAVRHNIPAIPSFRGSMRFSLKVLFWMCRGCFQPESGRSPAGFREASKVSSFMTVFVGMANWPLALWGSLGGLDRDFFLA